MNKKAILILSLIASAVLLTSLSITFVQSTRSLRIPTEWYQTVPSIISAEQWSWDWSVYETSGPWATGAPYILYKRVGDALFLTFPNTPILVAYRVAESLTWKWRGGETGMGGPMAAHLMMVNGTISITFTNEDIPLTDEDNDYKGLRMLGEMWIDLYGLEDVGGDNYLWHGLAHQRFVFWAPKGSRA